jgi:hypothetical protein
VRLTYCVLQRPEVQLQRFTSEGEEHGTSKVTTAIFLLNDTQSPVIFLETIPAQQNSAGQVSCDVVVVHRDGTIRRIAGDLSAQIWSTKSIDAPNASASNLTVRAAYWMSEEQAKCSFLKNRPDLCLGLDGRASGVLALIAKRAATSGSRAEEMIYGIWSVEEQRLSHALSGNTVHGANPLILHTLPDTERWINNDTAQCSFNSVNGALSVAFSHGLITYDLSTYIPEISSKLSLSTDGTSYLMRLTPSLAVGSTSSAVTLYDTKYQSIQSSVDLEEIGSKKKKRKGGNANQNSIRFIAYFAKIKRLVACRGHALIAFDITNSDRKGNHSTLSGDSMLIDAVGRGMQYGSPQPMEISNAACQEFGIVSRRNLNQAIWVSQQKRLDDIAEKGDITAFDELMAKQLCDSSNGERFDQGTLRLPRSPFYVDQAKIDYLVSKIFEPFSNIDVGMDESADFGNNLKIRLQSPRLIHWLALANQLTDRQVERALQRTRASQAFTVRPGAVVFALTRDQPSYEMITDYLKHSPSLPLYEILQAIKLLLGDVVADATRRLSPTLLQEGDPDHMMSFPADAMPGVQGDHAGAMQTAALELKLPSDDVMAPNPSSVALLIALELFGSHSSQNITAELRSKLSQSQILSIIQILRQQLFHSGHTSYLPTPPTSAQASPKLGNTHAGEASLNLDSILKLLSSCLDAIGPVGFLAQSENDEFLEKLIPDLKSEISFAFEGMQETNHLQGLLREVTRYANSMQMSEEDHVTHSPSKHSSLQGHHTPGTIVTLYTEPKADQGDVEGRGALLPLSLRANDVISETKVRKGGGQVSKRSRRDIMKLKDRNVGVYSYERLVL